MKKIKLTRLDNDKNFDKDFERLSFKYQNERYTITPDFDGFRIHKHPINKDERINIFPACSNEIIIK